MSDVVPATPAGPRRRPGLGATGWVGLGIVGIFALLAVAAPWLAPYRVTALAGDPLQALRLRHLLGTNSVGQDVASQLLAGARTSLWVAVVAGGGTVVIGSLVGGLAGWTGGLTDALAVRLADLILVVPAGPLLIVIGAYTRPSLVNVSVIIALTCRRCARPWCRASSAKRALASPFATTSCGRRCTTTSPSRFARACISRSPGRWPAPGRRRSRSPSTSCGGRHGGDALALEWLRRAADEATVRAPAVAAELLERALVLFDAADPGRDELMADPVVALEMSGRRQEAEAACVELLGRPQPPRIEARVRLCLARLLTWRGQFDEAGDQATRAAYWFQAIYR